jgi:putative transposase
MNRTIPRCSRSHQTEKNYAITSAHVGESVNSALASPGWQRMAGLLTFREKPAPSGEPPEPSPYSESFGALLDKATRAEFINAYCATSGETRWTMYRTLRAYCQGGMTPDAAVEEYDKCGTSGSPRIYVEKPGRRNTISPAVGVARSEIVETQLLLAAERYLSTRYGAGARKRRSMEDCLLWVLTKFYATSIEIDDDGFITELELEESRKPSLRQLQYILETRYTYSERQIAKVGPRRWDLEQRPLFGRLRNSKGPGQCFHIDATPANVYLVNRLMRSRVAGRPYIFTVVDDYSALIAGVYVAFEPPSWQGAMMALLNAVTPKVAYCASLGIEITEVQWPSYWFPREHRH